MAVTIAPKQYAHMTDLMAAWVTDPDDFEKEQALIEYQDEIHWPWRATQEQRDDWNRQYTQSWDGHLAAAKGG